MVAHQNEVRNYAKNTSLQKNLSKRFEISIKWFMLKVQMRTQMIALGNLVNIREDKLNAVHSLKQI